MKTPDKNAAALILSAGLSSRMQTDKALLMANAEQTFLEKICRTYKDWGCSELIVVVNKALENKIKNLPDIPSTLKLVINGHLEYGRFYSVQTGLSAIINTPFCFIQNIDNPFINAEVLDLLYSQKDEKSTVVPVYQGKGGHPVLLGSEIMKQIKNDPVKDNNLKEFLYRFHVKRIETAFANVLTNINYPAEYDKFVKNLND